MKVRLIIFLLIIYSRFHSQTLCVVNGSFYSISSICQGQTASLTTNTLNYCYTYGYLPTNLQNSLVSYYPFCGNAFDENLMNNNFSSFASLTTDRFGDSNRAYDFNGTSSNMQGGGWGYPTGNAARTISLWFYNRGSLSTGPDSIASNIFCAGMNNINSTLFQILHMSPSLGGNIKIDFIGSSITTTLAAGFNSWQFFAFVLDASSNYTTYVNGNIAGTGTLSINSPANPVVHLGFSVLSNPAPKYWFNGKIDEVFIYSRDLSQSEIMQLYNVNTIPYTYSWSTGATTSSITVSPSVTTVYTLSATNGFYSCTASSTVAVSPCTGIEEFSKTSANLFYPNPVKSHLFIKPEVEVEPGLQAEIRNAIGEKVSVIPLSKEMDVSQLLPGIYFLKIYAGNKEFNFRFVKE